MYIVFSTFHIEKQTLRGKSSENMSCLSAHVQFGDDDDWRARLAANDVLVLLAAHYNVIFFSSCYCDSAPNSVSRGILLC